MPEGNVSVRVSAESFAQAVHDAAANGSGLEGIETVTGLKRSAINSRLSNLRKLVGKDNVPSFQGGPRLDKDKLVAILKGQEVQQ
jgi:hypothetical protein